VAVALYISPKTVEFHLGRIYRKLGVGRRTQLTRALLLGEEFEPLVEVWDSPT
jgi:DNA-binding CsgD family transcriptional regulator